ncbi:hypothetical protein [Nocardia africana]|uniref:hypothetical protein n=1 Tax=Nocardia africana TaxID=134964 RepID=UPI000A5360EB|nr:hypothetical protein [Nocardia africana]MCC3313971.1 hypothetical protein [Nocardia africana]
MSTWDDGPVRQFSFESKGGAHRGWRAAVGPLTAEQRALVITTLRAYEEAVSSG